MADDAVKTTWILEMTDSSQLQPKRVDDPAIEIRQVEVPCPEFNWFLHQAVGTDFRWGGREEWGKEQWTDYVNKAGLETWVLWVQGSPAGYFELEMLADGSAEIHCFGLLRQFFGRGLGSHLLTFAIERAWSLKPSRLWLSTCSHDHPHAVRNYEARGFRVVDELTKTPNNARASVLFTN